MKHFRWSTAKVVFVFLEERRLRANIQVKKTPGINLGKGTDSQWLLWISDFVNSQKWKKHRIQIDSWNNPPPIILCLRYLWAWEPSRFVTRSGFHWSVIQSVLNLRTGTSFIGPRFALLDLKATSNLIYHDKKIISFFQFLYSNSRIRVRAHGNLSSKFTTRRGFRQGCSLWLFTSNF